MNCKMRFNLPVQQDSFLLMSLSDKVVESKDLSEAAR